MKYLIAFAIFVSIWFLGTVVVWLTTGIVASIRYDEGIMMGWGSDWRNRTSTVVALTTAIYLTALYLRGARKRHPKTPDA